MEGASEVAASNRPPTPSWHGRATTASEQLGIEHMDAEAMYQVQAMELARLAAEERARLDEEEWCLEEQRLQEEEDWQREVRAAREEGEYQEEVKEANQAEQDASTADADNCEPANPTYAATLTELLGIDGNDICFDCDAPLTSGASGVGPEAARMEAWWSATHGTLLCADCARVHRGLQPRFSRVLPVEGIESHLLSPELDVLYAGGNRNFAYFLDEESVGVPRHVWLAMPIDARYLTPAAGLYQRRLCALVDGQSVLPTELERVTLATSERAMVDREDSQHQPPPTKDCAEQEILDASRRTSTSASTAVTTPPNEEASNEGSDTTTAMFIRNLWMDLNSTPGLTPAAFAEMRSRITAARAPLSEW